VAIRRKGEGTGGGIAGKRSRPGEEKGGLGKQKGGVFRGKRKWSVIVSMPPIILKKKGGKRKNFASVHIEADAASGREKEKTMTTCFAVYSARVGK